jgi:hypothetical protein
MSKPFWKTASLPAAAPSRKPAWNHQRSVNVLLDIAFIMGLCILLRVLSRCVSKTFVVEDGFTDKPGHCLFSKQYSFYWVVLWLKGKGTLDVTTYQSYVETIQCLRYIWYLQHFGGWYFWLQVLISFNRSHSLPAPPTTPQHFTKEKEKGKKTYSIDITKNNEK